MKPLKLPIPPRMLLRNRWKRSRLSPATVANNKTKRDACTAVHYGLTLVCFVPAVNGTERRTLLT
jgi:hypothetical protein